MNIEDIKIPADMASLHNLHSFKDIVNVHYHLQKTMNTYASEFLNSVIKTKEQVLAYIPEHEHKLYQSRSEIKYKEMCDYSSDYIVDTQAKKIIDISKFHGSTRIYFEENKFIVTKKHTKHNRFQYNKRTGEVTATLTFDSNTLQLISYDAGYKSDDYHGNGWYNIYVSKPIDIKEENKFKREQQKKNKLEREKLTKAMEHLHSLPHNLQVVNNKFQNDTI